MKKRMYGIMVCCSVLCLMLPAAANAKTYDECGFMAKTGLVLASVITTPLYFVCKLPLAAVGAAVSAPVNFLTMRYAYDFSANFALRTMCGDWYITPSVLLGDRKLQYFGPVD
jgi:hypothetical protein